MREEEENSGKPKINPVSARLAEESEMFRNNRDFLSRQRAYAQRKERERAEATARARETEPRAKPRVSGVSELIVASQPSRAGESFAERLERLSYRDKERTDKLRRSVQDEYYAQFTHKPKINKISSIIAKGHTHEELYHDERSKAVRQQATRAAEEAFQKAHPFRPKINPDGDQHNNSTTMGGVMSRSTLALDRPDEVLTRIAEYKTRREERLEELRMSREYDELRDCTFKPALAPKIAQPTGPVIVPGLGKHLSRAEEAKRQQDEQRRREDEVFGAASGSRLGHGSGAADMHKSAPATLIGAGGGGSGYGYGGPSSSMAAAVGYTIPEPFALSSDPHAHIRRARIRQEALAAELSECTFRPKTAAARDEAIVRRVLQDAGGGGGGGGGGGSSVNSSAYGAYDRAGALDDDGADDNGDEFDGAWSEFA
jgi:hypothetical protein